MTSTSDPPGLKPRPMMRTMAVTIGSTQFLPPGRSPRGPIMTFQSSKPPGPKGPAADTWSTVLPNLMVLVMTGRKISFGQWFFM